MPIKKAHQCRKLIVSALTAQTLLKESTEQILGGNLSRSVRDPSLGRGNPSSFPCWRKRRRGNTGIDKMSENNNNNNLFTYIAPFNIKMIKSALHEFKNIYKNKITIMKYKKYYL